VCPRAPRRARGSLCFGARSVLRPLSPSSALALLGTPAASLGPRPGARSPSPKFLGRDPYTALTQVNSIFESSPHYLKLTFRSCQGFPTSQYLVRKVLIIRIHSYDMRRKSSVLNKIKAFIRVSPQKNNYE